MELQWLVLGYDFNYDEFHACVHGTLPYEKSKPDPVLRQLLSLPQRKIIFTNSDKAHAATVLKKLGLEDCFEGVICFETLNPSTIAKFGFSPIATWVLLLRGCPYIVCDMTRRSSHTGTEELLRGEWKGGERCLPEGSAWRGRLGRRRGRNGGRRARSVASDLSLLPRRCVYVLDPDHALEMECFNRGSSSNVAYICWCTRMLFVANAGDCRAVLGKRGQAVELSRDHKPNCKSEKIRIENLGGTVFYGYLNGQLAVARALGDWHMKGPKGSISPLSAEPELQEVVLTEEDEFLIIGCDGLWDVMSSQCAVTIVRKELMSHNHPERCSSELVQEALKRNSCDNLTVVVICFSSNPPPQIEVPRSRVRRSISLEGLHLLRGALDSNA